VEVENKNTEQGNVTSGIQTVIADGESQSSGYSLITKDGCLNQLDSGSLDERVKAVYLEKVNTTTGTYTNGSLVPFEESATVVDNDDGTYHATLVTENAGEYSVFYTFGDQCELVYDINSCSSDPCSDVVVTVNDPVNCVLMSVFDAVIAVPVPPPTPSPVSNIDIPDDNSQLVKIASSTGSILFLAALVGVFMFVRYQRRWSREKKFVADGKRYILEANTELAGDDPLSVTTSQVMATSAEILRRAAAAEADPKTAAIMKLKLQNEEMREANRMKKKALDYEAGREAKRAIQRAKRDRMEL